MKNKLMTLIAVVAMLFACNAEYTPEQILKLNAWQLYNAITKDNADAVAAIAKTNDNYGALMLCAGIKGEPAEVVENVTKLYNSATNWAGHRSVCFMHYVNHYDIQEATEKLLGEKPNKYACAQLFGSNATLKKYPILRTLKDTYLKEPIEIQKVYLNECFRYFAYVDDQTDKRAFNASLSPEVKTHYRWVWMMMNAKDKYHLIYDMDQTVSNYFNSKSSLEPEAIKYNETILRKYYALNGDAAFFKKNIGAIPADAQVKVILEFNDIDMLIAALKIVPENLEPEQVKQIVLLFNSLDVEDARKNDVLAILKNINKKYTLKMYDDQKTWEPIISRVRALIEVMSK